MTLKPSRPEGPTSRLNGPSIAPERATIAPARAYRFPSLSPPFSFFYMWGYRSTQSVWFPPPPDWPTPGATDERHRSRTLANNSPLMLGRAANSMQNTVEFETMTTLGGRVRCRQCSAKSKRTGVQCRAPAIKDKTKCKTHGGKSTGPRTPEGKARVAAAHLVHGWETRQSRRERSEGLARLAELETLGRLLGMLAGPRTRGPKPKG
jgi:hypothetical protein